MSLIRQIILGLFVAVICFVLVMPAAAAPRQNVVLEHFTNTGCDPCASNNPILLSAMNSSTRDTVIKISTHTWWPGATDPFYQWNITDNTNRTNYYGINSVPRIRIDGNINITTPFNSTTIRTNHH